MENNWISVEERLPTNLEADENDKVLVYRITTSGQRGLSKSIIDWYMVKHMDKATFWQSLPPPPSKK